MPFSAMQDNGNTTKCVSACEISACSFIGGGKFGLLDFSFHRRSLRTMRAQAPLAVYTLAQKI